VSKQIAALEAQLGVRLLRRSTRKLSMTEEGERLYAEARRIVEEVSEVESQLKGGGQPQGTLRVACPPVFARMKLLPHAATFLSQYPQPDWNFPFMTDSSTWWRTGSMSPFASAKWPIPGYTPSGLAPRDASALPRRVTWKHMAPPTVPPNCASITACSRCWRPARRGPSKVCR
jgi:hypothetical protein